MPAWRRTSRKKTQKDLENEEYSMASRLQLELGMGFLSIYSRTVLTSAQNTTKWPLNPGKKGTRKSQSFAASLSTTGCFYLWKLVSMSDVCSSYLTSLPQYAFLLTQRDQYPLADEVLRHAAQSVVFQDPLPADVLRLALMGRCVLYFEAPKLKYFVACAIRARSYDTIVAMSRKLINSHQFHNDPPRILLSALASGLMSVDAFIDSRLQKHLSREVRLIDAVVKGKDVRWNPHLRRYHLTGADEGTKDDADEGEGTSVELSTPDKPTKNNPIMVCIYGQLCVAARSYQSGICERCLSFTRSCLIFVEFTCCTPMITNLTIL